MLIAQLEILNKQGDLTLSKLWFYLQPSIKIIDSVYRLCLECKNKNGGMMLNIIYNLKCSSSDDEIKNLYNHFLSSSSEPFLNMLYDWLSWGIVDDPFKEFMIIEHDD